MFLVIYIADNEPFDIAVMDKGLARLEGVTAINHRSIGCFSAYELYSGEAATLIRLDASSIMVDGINDASLSAALRISQMSGRPVRVVDDANTFDLNLSNIESVDELADAINDAGARRASAYQSKVAGRVERRITGGGEIFWSDGLDFESVVEAKLLTSATRSPFLSESNASDFIRAEIARIISGEFARLALILQDFGNPLTRVKVVVSDRRLARFFKGQIKRNRLKGNVVVTPE